MARDTKKLTVPVLLSNLLILFSFGISPTCYVERYKPSPHVCLFPPSTYQRGLPSLESKVDEKFIAQETRDG